jgi:hypothetical protein
MIITYMTAAMFRMIEFPILASTALMDAILDSGAKAVNEDSQNRQHSRRHHRRQHNRHHRSKAHFNQRAADTFAIRNAA